MKVDAELTRKLAQLARLRLTEAEIAEFTAQLGKIIDYVGQLQVLKVEGVEPLLYPSMVGTEDGMRLRPDEARTIPADAVAEPYRVPQVVS